MEKINLKEVKEVKGKKVNHPYETGNIIYMVLLLLLVAFPCSIMFIPLLGFESNPNLSINGVDLFKFLFIDQAVITKPAMSKLGMTGSTNVTVQKIIAYMLMGQGVFTAIFMLLSLIFLIYLIVSLFKGYIKKAYIVRNLTILELVLSIIFSLSFFTYYILDVNFNNSRNNILYATSLICSGLMIVLLIATCICYNQTYKDVVYEKDLRIVKVSVPDPVNEDKAEEKKEETKQGFYLPDGITSIASHEYAENQEIVDLDIPNGVSKIGVGAFANCLKLETVHLPKSIKNIGFNCFFHCEQLSRIYYAGTKEEWRGVKRGSNWLAKCKTNEISCIDGPLVVNPFN